MNPRAEWGLPIALAILAAAATVAWDPFSAAPAALPSPDPIPVGPLGGAQSPFDSVVAPADLVYVSDKGRLPPNGTGLAGTGALYSMHDGTSLVTLAHVAPAPVDCAMPCGLGLRLLPSDGLRLGVDAPLAMLSIYVFDDVGSLLATNTNDTRFGVPSARLPDDAWYFGDGEPPAGTTSVARVGNGILRGYAPLLDGAVRGSVVSALVEDHAYAGLVGPLYVTVRVDEVLV